MSLRRCVVGPFPPGMPSIRHSDRDVPYRTQKARERYPHSPCPAHDLSLLHTPPLQQLNVDVPAHLAALAKELGFTLIFISTGYSLFFLPRHSPMLNWSIRPIYRLRL